MTTINDSGPPRRGALRGRMRPIASGATGCLVCSVALGALMTSHPQPVAALASAITTADLLSIDHNTGAYYGGSGGVVVHHTPTGDVLDNLPAAVGVNAIVDVGRDALGNDEVYAAGDHGALYYQAGGNAWCRLAVPPAVFGENLHGISSLGSGRVVVVGTDGLVMELTGAAGCAATFVVDARIPGSPALNAVRHLAGGVVVVAGDAGTMLIGHADSTVHHLLFSPVVSGTLADLHGLAPSASGVIAVGAGGAVLNGSVSVDPGTTLPRLVTTVVTGIPTAASLRDAASGFAQDPATLVPTVVAVGDAGTILRSADGGVSWSVTASGTTATLHGVHLADLSTGTAVGAAGTLVRITFSGSAPTPTPSPTAAPTGSPTSTATASPSGDPTSTPTASPIGNPTSTPTTSPSASPASTPSPSPTAGPGGTTTSGSSTTSNGSTSTATTSTTTITTTVDHTTTQTATVQVTSVSTSTTTVNHGGGDGGGGSGGGGTTTPPLTPGTPEWAKRLVDELYLGVLARTADGAGEAYWVDQVMGHGQGPVAIAHALLGSVEYRTNLVQSAYWQYLGRSGESAGITYWVTAMGRGTTDETVRLSFIGSDEFWTNSGGNPRAYVDTLYTSVLQRQAEPAGEAYWVDRLNHGAPAYSIAAALIGSTEMLEQRVSGYYLTYLARSAGAGELAYWAAALAAGTRDEDVILGFVGSTEFLSRI